MQLPLFFQGLFTVIQRFAMVNHLAIKQSVTLTEMTGKFQWAVRTSRARLSLIFELQLPEWTVNPMLPQVDKILADGCDVKANSSSIKASLPGNAVLTWVSRYVVGNAKENRGLRDVSKATKVYFSFLTTKTQV